MSSRQLHRGFTIVELLVVVAILGILAAVALPTFVRFQARSKQSEARLNLQAIFTGERAYFAEFDSFTTIAASIGFSPERGNRYAYNLNVTCASTEDRSVVTPSPGAHECVGVDVLRYVSAAANPGYTGATPNWQPVSGSTAVSGAAGVSSANCPTCEFAAYAAGNIDNDTSIDVWQIGSAAAQYTSGPCWEGTPTGQSNPGGSAYNVNNDLGC